jgi:putative DNA methylase
MPLEGQRLGFEVHASDLNPVAVLVTKALIDIPHRFSGHRPMNPDAHLKLDSSGHWRGAQGLAEDIRFYGRWMWEEAKRRIGEFYPTVQLPREEGGHRASAIAWLWARTVRCPNPACGAQMPLVRSFWLSSKTKRPIWVEPRVDPGTKTIHFSVERGTGSPPDGTKVARGAKFRCLVCEQIADDEHIKAEGLAKRMGAQLLAVIAEGRGRRIYVQPDEEQQGAAKTAVARWAPDEELPYEPRAIWCTLYGLTQYRDLFTPRQLLSMTTFTDLVGEVRDSVLRDLDDSDLPADDRPLSEGGTGARAYSEAISVYLAFAVDKLADWLSSLCGWMASVEKAGHTLARQALPMVWDFAELNPFSGSVGNFGNHVEWVAEAVEAIRPAKHPGEAHQLDATAALNGAVRPLICTDPPYYDNIGYADLADFFYVWLRRAVRDVYPDLFSTLLTPKEQELIASPYRFGGNRRMADQFFEAGLGKAFERMREAQDDRYPLAFFYAFKQAEGRGNGSDDLTTALVSTGWETMLEALLRAGFVVDGTWPMRTERAARSLGIGTNALASSIVLVCRPRPVGAPLGTRGEFLKALRNEMPGALKKMQKGSIAPVDLAQAAIGPGMAVFSRFGKVLEADGSAMPVRVALGLINQVLDEVLTEQESEYDGATRWALAWFDQYGVKEGPYGVAETLSKAKNTAVAALVEDGFLQARAGKVRLLSRQELDLDWDPRTDERLSIWEVAQHLVRVLEEEGEGGAAGLLRKLGALGETARDLSYRLYTTCERKKWAQEAMAFNSLVVAWPEISRLAAEPIREAQPTLEV